MKGILLINKPKGMTSAAVVSKVRYILGTREVGHMGTLDPQGEGVLVLGLGKAARLFQLFNKSRKVYTADFDFGYETDTLDGDGKTVMSGGRIPDFSEIEKSAANLTGKLKQIPPKYSAKNIGGKRAYDMARNGEEFNLSACDVEVFSFDLLSIKDGKLSVKIECSSGTYIRSICRDLAYSLDTYATMTAIKRLECCGFGIDSCVTLENLNIIKEKAVIPLDEVLKNYPRADIEDSLYKKLSDGVPLFLDCPDVPFTVYCKGEIFGIGAKRKDGSMYVSVYLKD